MAEDSYIPTAKVSTNVDQVDVPKCCKCCPDWLRDVICCFTITVGICTTMTIVFAFTIFESPAKGNLKYPVYLSVRWYLIFVHDI